MIKGPDSFEPLMINLPWRFGIIFFAAIQWACCDAYEKVIPILIELKHRGTWGIEFKIPLIFLLFFVIATLTILMIKRDQAVVSSDFLRKPQLNLSHWSRPHLPCAEFKPRYQCRYLIPALNA